MHISEGVLATPVLIGGALAATAGLAVGLKRMKAEHAVAVAMVSAVFFLASLVHVPLGPANVHLVLNGMVGLVLGWAAFPAIFVALALQAVLFQYGGLTTLGVNTWNMACPAVACALLVRPLLRSAKPGIIDLGAFLCGFCALGLAGIGVSGCLALSGEAFLRPAGLILLGHLPLMFLEGIISLALVRFLLKVKAEVLAFVHTPDSTPR